MSMLSMILARHGLTEKQFEAAIADVLNQPIYDAAGDVKPLDDWIVQNDLDWEKQEELHKKAFATQDEYFGERISELETELEDLQAEHKAMKELFAP